MALDRRAFLGLGAAGAGRARRLPEAPGLPKRAARALRSAVKGKVLFPRTPGYDTARLVYNLRYDGMRPRRGRAAARHRGRGRVVKLGEPLRRPRGARARAATATPATRPPATASSSTSRRCAACACRTARATVGAGAQLIDMYSSLARRGLTVPGGSCPSVGVAGLALGGGHGLAGRRWGLMTDNIVAAHDRHRRRPRPPRDADSDEDLFWACQGGGRRQLRHRHALTLRTHRPRGASWFFISSRGRRRARCWRRGSASPRMRRPRSPRSARWARRAARARRRSRRSASTSARRPRCGG